MSPEPGERAVVRAGPRDGQAVALGEAENVADSKVVIALAGEPITPEQLGGVPGCPRPISKAGSVARAMARCESGPPPS